MFVKRGKRENPARNVSPVGALGKSGKVDEERRASGIATSLSP